MAAAAAAAAMCVALSGPQVGRFGGRRARVYSNEISFQCRRPERGAEEARVSVAAGLAAGGIASAPLVCCWLLLLLLSLLLSLFLLRSLGRAACALRANVASGNWRLLSQWSLALREAALSALI